MGENRRFAMYYYADANNAPQGPYTVAELQAMLQSGQIHAQTLIAAAGTQQWTPLSSILGPPPRTPALHAQPRGYAPSRGMPHAHAHGHAVPARHPAAMAHARPQRGSAIKPLFRRGGLQRLGYFFWSISISLLMWGAVIFLVANLAKAPSEKVLADGVKEVEFQAGGAFWVLLVLSSLGGAAAWLGASASRLSNIGWNPWLCLLLLVPLANIWIFASCMALPTGYGQTAKMDTAGKIILGLVLAGVILSGASIFSQLASQK